MSFPKVQHLVAKSILQNFADQEGKLHCYNKVQKKCFSLTPENALRESYFYTEREEDGTPTNEAEFRLRNIESAFKPLCADLIATARASSQIRLSIADVDTIRIFLKAQFVRSRGVWNLLKPRPWDERIKKDVWAELIFDAKLHPAMDGAVESTGMVLATYGELEKAFIVGDSPVCLLTNKQEGHSEIFLPIASDVAIALSSTVNRPTGIQLDIRTVNVVNREIAKHSETIATHCPVMTESIRNALSKEGDAS